MSRPACYPPPQAALLNSAARPGLSWLDVLTSPVPEGRFDSPVDERHVLCLHLGSPVPVTYRTAYAERSGTRLHGQFCVVPAHSSTRWTLTAPATSLLLRLAPSMLAEAASAQGLRDDMQLAPAIHIRDPHIERIGWMMQAEEQDAHPNGRLFADSLAAALAARLLTLQTKRPSDRTGGSHALPAWRLRHVTEYIEAHLDRDLSLQELATVAGFSLSHFKTLFRAATGQPVHRFVLERRIERARHLLQTTALSTTEIALQTGFAHPSHLARCLRRALGLTAADLRPARIGL
ncbi:AraC family transcriptional regulator [Massilia arenosa]|uniref:AraC family transcriptional regulator n=1 Tax=Zemynaea arenosa TaxID=2561931 RepID=A0A4Y9SS76_9BURK|nr:AraC family transcriptional regulator [Massilia arenosa]TFW28347.1 AraC family transcriptional regulator [Massilia arenosa]